MTPSMVCSIQLFIIYLLCFECHLLHVPFQRSRRCLPAAGPPQRSLKRFPKTPYYWSIHSLIVLSIRSLIGQRPENNPQDTTSLVRALRMRTVATYTSLINLRTTLHTQKQLRQSGAIIPMACCRLFSIMKLRIELCMQQGSQSSSRAPSQDRISDE